MDNDEKRDDELEEMEDNTDNEARDEIPAEPEKDESPAPNDDNPPEEEKEMAEKEVKKDEYAEVLEDFVRSAERVTDSFQEQGPRQINLVSVYVDSHSGVICTTNERGLPKLTVAGTETDPQGRKKRQRFYIGVQVEATTKGKAIQSEDLGRYRSPKLFEITSQVDQRLKSTIESAQTSGDKMQKKIDEDNYEWFSLLSEDKVVSSIYEDHEEEPDLHIIKDLVSSARERVVEKIGTKAKDIKASFIKWSEHYLYADSNGRQCDQVIPRMAFMIRIETKDGNEAFGMIRGSMGTIAEILGRYLPEDASEEDRDVKNIVKKLADDVVKEAIDLDRAQGRGILGDSAPVILGPGPSGVLAHEVLGHPAEGDIICENRRDKHAKVQLKSRIGAQVSNHSAFNVIDTPDAEVSFENKKIRYNFGALPIDGYGTEGKTVFIVQNGIMIGTLCDRRNIEEIVHGLKEDVANAIRTLGPTGSVRREKFDAPPQDRMRNTIILPNEKGPDSLEAMAAKIPKNKKGVYIHSLDGGMVNTSNGDFALIGRLCYLIENGQITDKPIKDVIVKGNITKFNQTIKEIGSSKTMTNTFSGYCGKSNQWVPVDGAGPILYLDEAQIGGASYRPWTKVVADYCVAAKLADKKKYIPEIVELVDPDHDEGEICLVTCVLPHADEVAVIEGRAMKARYEMGPDGKAIDRGDRYE